RHLHLDCGTNPRGGLKFDRCAILFCQRARRSRSILSSAVMIGSTSRFLLDHWSMHSPRLSILIASLLAITSDNVASAESEEPSDKIVSRIPRERVASSAIASVGYSKRAGSHSLARDSGHDFIG